MAESRRKLKEQRDALLAALEAVEWSAPGAQCPLCHGDQHSKDCLIYVAKKKVVVDV